MNDMSKNGAILNLFTQNINQDENFSLNKSAVADYALTVVAKSTASREKLNKSKANDSTPLNRAFFVRSLRTPNENTAPKNRASGFLSMVGRKGQPLAVGCFSFDGSFLTPLRFTASREKPAESLYNQSKETAKMIYKFLCLNRTKGYYNQENLYIEADSEENARFQLTADYRLLLDRPIGKFHQHPAVTGEDFSHSHPFSPPCDCTKQQSSLYETTNIAQKMQEKLHKSCNPEQIPSLPSVGGCGYDGVTTSKDGHRSRYTSGIFLSQIYLSNGNGENPHTYPKAEFVEWLISRNKPSNRTNKASRSFAVVETISHPLQGGNSLLTKQKRLFKMPTIQSVTTPQKHPPLHLATFSHNLTACTQPQGGIYA